MCDAAWCAPCTWAPLRWAVPTKGRYNKCSTFTLFFIPFLQPFPILNCLSHWAPDILSLQSTLSWASPQDWPKLFVPTQLLWVIPHQLTLTSFPWWRNNDYSVQNDELLCGHCTNERRVRWRYFSKCCRKIYCWAVGCRSSFQAVAVELHQYPTGSWLQQEQSPSLLGLHLVLLLRSLLQLNNIIFIIHPAIESSHGQILVVFL